jgi:hypothetical protein
MVIGKNMVSTCPMRNGYLFGGTSCKVSVTSDMPADMPHIEHSHYRDLTVAEATATSMNTWGWQQGAGTTLRRPRSHVASVIQPLSHFVPYKDSAI